MSSVVQAVHHLAKQLTLVWSALPSDGRGVGGDFKGAGGRGGGAGGL